jgi:tRNA(Arg) A34 adenosine deaminase TadA
MMPVLSRRSLVAALAGVAALLSPRARAAAVQVHLTYVEEAFAMKRRAIESGDQPFGAVVVREGTIVGYGPSRVVLKNDNTAHAEREAMRDAQTRLGRQDLSDCVMYSTSPPCSACRQAAAEAGLGRMYAGADAADLGPPRQSQ